MSLTRLMADALPLNRKEKYYTGTIFPGIVCADNFRHFNVFARLLPGSPSFVIDPHPNTTNIQFFTEYSPLHSFVGAAKARMLEIPASNETPDVAIVIEQDGSRAMIVLEAKVFDAASAGELNTQLRKQEPFIECVRRSIGVSRVFHAALIPEGFSRTFRGFEYPIVTWDSLHTAYAAVIPDNYFLSVLGFALEGFESLRSSSNQSRGQNADAYLSGAEIRRRFKDGSLEYRCMGRQSGRYGSELARDFESGRWATVSYEVRRDAEPPNRNWFPIAEFVGGIPAGNGSTRNAPVTRVRTKSKMLGAQILREHERGTLWFKTVGRSGGVSGAKFLDDARTGRWKTQNYEVSTSSEPENRNWFLVEDFARSIG